MDWYPKPKKNPESTGTIQWIVGLAVQASQKSEIVVAMLPTQDIGRRCVSGLKDRGKNQILRLLRSRADEYLESQVMATRAVEAAPIPTEESTLVWVSLGVLVKHTWKERERGCLDGKAVDLGEDDRVGLEVEKYKSIDYADV
jgi:hypothetical protein